MSSCNILKKSMAVARDVLNSDKPCCQPTREGSVIVEIEIYLLPQSSLNNASLEALRSQLTSGDGTDMLTYFKQGLQRYVASGNVPALTFANTSFTPVTGALRFTFEK